MSYLIIQILPIHFEQLNQLHGTRNDTLKSKIPNGFKNELVCNSSFLRISNENISSASTNMFELVFFFSQLKIILRAKELIKKPRDAFITKSDKKPRDAFITECIIA